MKRISRSFFLLLLSFTFICAFSVTPVLAHDSGDDTPDHSVSAIACETSDNLGQDVVKAYPPKHVASMSDSDDDMVAWSHGNPFFTGGMVSAFTNEKGLKCRRLTPM